MRGERKRKKKKKRGGGDVLDFFLNYCVRSPSLCFSFLFVREL